MAKASGKLARSERKLFIVTGAVVVALLGFGAWRSYLNSIPEGVIPTPQLPNPNAYDFYMQAGEAIIPAIPAVDAAQSRTMIPEAQWKSRYPTVAKEAWLRQNITALKLLRQAFQYQCKVPPLRSRKSKLWGTNAKSLREVARLLSVDSHAKSERSNWNDAAQSALDILRLGNDISRGGALTDFLISASINAIGRRELWKIRTHLTIAETKIVSRRLEEIIAKRASFEDVMGEEKYEGQAGLLEFMRANRWLIAPKTSALPSVLTAVAKSAVTPRHVVFKDYSNYMDALIARAGEPYISKTKLPAIPIDIFSQWIAPTYESPRWNYARDEIGNDLLLVAFALQEYHLENKKYPQILKQLVPRYLKKIPKDSFGSGETLRYKKSGAEYSLYSIGPDGIDDKGRAIESTKIKDQRKRFIMQPNSKGDFVAGTNS